MKKGILLGFIMGGGILIVMSLIVLSGRKAGTEQKSVGTTPAPTRGPVAMATWKDVVGFTFQYPEGLAVNKHDEDKENYAHVELTDASHAGNVIVWLKDLPKIKNKTVTDVSQWVENEPLFTGGTMLDTKLGDAIGKKILVKSPERKVYVATIYDDLLYLIEATPGSDGYWQEVFDTVTRSFVLHPVQASSASSSQPAMSDNVSVDEEETIE